MVDYCGLWWIIVDDGRFYWTMADYNGFWWIIEIILDDCVLLWIMMDYLFMHDYYGLSLIS